MADCEGVDVPKGTCSLSDCERKAYCRGICRPHYEAERGYDRKSATCVACGVEYQRARRATTDWCPPCAYRSPARSAAAKRRPSRRTKWPTSPVYFPTCPTCWATFTARRPRVYCTPACYPVKALPPGHSAKPCAGCGAPKENYRARWCDTCRETRLGDHRKAWRAKRPKGQENNRRRARHFGVDYEPIKNRDVFERDGWLCGICGERIDKRLKYPNPRSASLDHVVPMSRGGSHTYSNVQASHWICNTNKGARSAGDQLALFG